MSLKIYKKSCTIAEPSSMNMNHNCDLYKRNTHPLMNKAAFIEVTYTFLNGLRNTDDILLLSLVSFF